MLALLAKSNPYLGIPEPDMEILYILGLVFAIASVFVVVFRGLGKWNESRKVRASSWRTFIKIAKVKGLSNMERRTLEIVVRKANPKRPSQVLGSITLFDRCVDQAIDKGVISDVEQALMDTARDKLIRTSVKWDGHTNRRQFERAHVAFDIQAFLVPKSDIDEELKSSYEESDTKFQEALDGIAAQTPSVGSRVLDFSAGGLALLIQDKNALGTGDYVKLAPGDDTAPFEVEGIVGRVISSVKMEEQGQLTLNIAFLPIEQELRRQIIAAVYAGQAETGAKDKKKAPKTKPPPVHTPSPSEDATPVSETPQAN